MLRERKRKEAKTKSHWKKKVNITIGLMEWREKESKLMVKRGKKIILRVSTLSTPAEIRILAENKWKEFHPDLYDDHNEACYKLLDESGVEINTIPASEEPFVLNKYQHEVQKYYKRITMYLCKNSDGDQENDARAYRRR